MPHDLSSTIIPKEILNKLLSEEELQQKLTQVKKKLNFIINFYLKIFIINFKLTRK